MNLAARGMIGLALALPYRWRVGFGGWLVRRVVGPLAGYRARARENLALIADTSISGARVARELDALVRTYGKPACIVSDNGTEFTSKAILKWANENGVEWHYIERKRQGAPVG